MCNLASNEIDEKPGVSATNPPNSVINSVCLVVCFPRPNALEISAVLIFKLVSNIFNKVDLPAPVWPVNTVIVSLNSFFIFRFLKKDRIFLSKKSRLLKKSTHYTPKKCFNNGITRQDGSFLAVFLLDKGVQKMHM